MISLLPLQVVFLHLKVSSTWLFGGMSCTLWKFVFSVVDESHEWGSTAFTAFMNSWIPFLRSAVLSFLGISMCNLYGITAKVISSV